MKFVLLQGEKIPISASECWYVMDEDRLNKKYTPAADKINHDLGVYIFWGWNDNPIRIGKAVKTRNRVLSYGNSMYWSIPILIEKTQYVSYIRCKNMEEAVTLELRLIKEYQPFYNTHGK